MKKRPTRETAVMRAALSPDFIAPQLATLRTRLSAGPAWLHEAKFDGYRLQLHKRDDAVVVYTRSGHDWTKRLPPIAVDLAKLPADEVIIDGELISAGEDGMANFSALQDDLKRGRYDRMVYYAFDILHLDASICVLRPGRAEARSGSVARQSRVGGCLDNPRVSNGSQVDRVDKLALGRKPSVDTGYWQRRKPTA